MNSSKPAMQINFHGTLGGFKLDAAFEAPMHGITAILGPSGSGKTTLLRCVAGLTRLPGELRVSGEVWQDKTGVFRAPCQRSIGYVFQEPSLFPHLSVRGNLLYGYQRALKSGAPERVPWDEVVALMELSPLLERTTAALSGGERQRVAIGRALLTQPRVLLMDEPLAALDRGSREEILPYFEALHQSLSIPILYVTHDLAEVEPLADILVLLEGGRVAAAGPITDLLLDVRSPIASRIGATAIVEAPIKAFDARYGLTALDLNGKALLVPGQLGEIGKMRRIRIAAADISLARECPSSTSILNVLPARVMEIHPIGQAQVNVVIRIGHGDGGGTKLLARISRRALETLAFAPGQDVYAQVKAVSLISSRY